MPESRQQRILLVTRNLPPLVGGMERLNWHMAKELSKYAEVRIVGPAGSAVSAPATVTVDEVPLRPLWKFLVRVQWCAWRVSCAWKPDVVVAGSGLTALAAWYAARSCGAWAAVYAHGLDLAVRHPVYRYLWWPALRHMDRVIVNSHPTAILAQAIGVQLDRIGVVFPGVALPANTTIYTDKTAEPEVTLFHTSGISKEESAPDFRRQYGLGNRPLLLSVGRLSTRKGLREFVTQALPHIVAAHPDALLLVVGDAPRDALHAETQTPHSIQMAAKQAGVGGNLRFIGTISDYRVLGSIYCAANVHVFPVRDIPGDPEGFGMVAVEAAAHGLPTVAFATGGVIDAVADGKSGCLIASGDYVAFAQAVQLLLAGRGILRESCMAFAAQFTWPLFGEGIRKQLPFGRKR